jgi:hypothetical protein
MAGCAGLPVLNIEYDPSYVVGESRVNGDNLTVVIRGNPYPVPKAEFDQAVVDAMQGAGFANQHLTTDGSPNSVYRVILVFSASPGVGAYRLCARPFDVEGAFGTAPQPRVPLVAALCRGDVWVSSADGSLGTAGGPAGGDFRDGLRQLGVLLFPGHSPRRDRAGECASC